MASSEIKNNAVSVSQRVHLYLSRVVKALAEYEDSLLREDGFFARSDHFEVQVDNLRAEFEANERGQAFFSQPEAVQLLVSQLISELPEEEPDNSCTCRRLEFVFAASVLLTAKTTVHTMLAHPSILADLLSFIQQPRRLHSVQLQYWCRCAGVLLVSHQPSIKGLWTEHGVISGLMKHLYSESVSMLLKLLLGLVGSPRSPQLLELSTPLSAFICGERASSRYPSRSLLTTAIQLMCASDDLADEMCDLLCSVCDILPCHADAVELAAAFTHSLLPSLDAMVALISHRCTNAAPTTRFLTHCLQMEQRCEALQRELLSLLPLQIVDVPSDWPASLHLASAPPLATRLLPSLPPLLDLLLHSRSALQLHLAKLLITYVAFAPAPIRALVAPLGMIESFVQLFLSRDVNGGGRQDKLRLEMLKALTAILASDDAEYIDILIIRSRLLERLLGAIQSVDARHYSPEHIRRLVLALSEASANSSLVNIALQHHASTWKELQIAADRPRLPAAALKPEPPAAISPASYLSADSAAVESLLIKAEQWECEVDDVIALTADQSDSENVDPNSPPPSPTFSNDGLCKIVSSVERAVEGIGLSGSCRSHASEWQSGGSDGVESDAESPPTPTPPPLTRADSPALMMVDRANFRRADDFSRDTPQPKLVRRAYLHRRAKEGSPFGSRVEATSLVDDIALLSRTVRSLTF